MFWVLQSVLWEGWLVIATQRFSELHKGVDALPVGLLGRWPIGSLRRIIPSLNIRHVPACAPPAPSCSSLFSFSSKGTVSPQLRSSIGATTLNDTIYNETSFTIG